MKRLLLPLATLWLASASGNPARAQVTVPQLTVTLQPDQQATVAWKDETGVLVLEETGDIADPDSWTRVLQRPVVSGEGVMVPLVLAGQNRIHRRHAVTIRRMTGGTYFLHDRLRFGGVCLGGSFGCISGRYDGADQTGQRADESHGISRRHRYLRVKNAVFYRNTPF